MKKLFLLFFAGIFVSCTSTDEIQIEIKNSSNHDRADASVILKADQLNLNGTGMEGLLPVVKDENGAYIPSQADDLDGDGNWDELFILTDFKGNEVKTATLEFLEASEYPEFKIRTNIRFAKKEGDYKEVKTATRETHANNTITQEIWQMEGIAWENDKLGFRNYFDRRNGMDIFGKVTTEMVLDGVGYKNNQSYHEFNPEWGVDVLKVGNSLGAGSVAYMYKDSLYRLGDNGTGTCQVLVEGPLRSIFRLEFEDWSMTDQVLHVVNDVSIEAGKYYFESSVTYTGSDEPLQLVTGIVNKKSKVLYSLNSDTKYPSFYTHDLQAEDTTLLGMGIMVASEDLIEIKEAPKKGRGIIETYCVHIKTEKGVPATYWFYSVWERENETWETAEGFKALLEKDAEYQTHPLVLRILKK